jgi:hypothetical protein
MAKITYPIVVKLEYPVEFGQETIFELRLRRVKGKEFRLLKSEEPSVDEMMDILGRLSGQPPSVIDELDGDDLQAAFEAMGKCMPRSPETLKQR